MSGNRHGSAGSFVLKNSYDLNTDQRMSRIEPTKNALLLNQALNAVGIETVLEYWDGHKHIDICIPKGKIYVEIDGPQHYTNPVQIVSDLKRDQYSSHDGFHTMRLPNEVIVKDAIKIARAIKKILNISSAV